MPKPLVSIVMGSDSDLPTKEEAVKILEAFEVEYELTISSAHRAPERTRRYAQEATKRGVKVIIAGAGGAAHLAGMIAAETTLPVVGVPIDSSSLKGLDALLSTVQMPGGVPVATMAIGRAGARNGAILAVQILALSDPVLFEKLERYKASLAKEVEEMAARVKKR